nr:immunoglobulin light chain junction region [Macaca mulatta]
CFQGLELPRTF